MTPIIVAGTIAAVVLLTLLAALAFHLVRSQPAYARGARNTASGRTIAALAFSLVVAIAVGSVITAASGNNFQLAGIQRYLTAPLIYAAFGIVLLTSTPLIPRPPAWVTMLTLLVAVSTLLSPWTSDSFAVASLNQGLVLLIGIPLLGLVGLLGTEWTEKRKLALVVVLCGTGATSGVLGLQNGVFSALTYPASVALIYLALHRVRGWPVLAATGVFVVVSSQIANSEAQDPSAATSGQLVVAGALFIVALLPVRARAVVMIFSAFVGLLAALSSPVPGLMLGVGSDLDDITLAQRAYETQAVFEQAQKHPLALLIGGGPGATVDLVASPDASTLEGSGRDLLAVPSLHLLTTYIILKLGALGILWLIVFLISIGRVGWRTLSAAKPDRTQVILLVFLATAVVQALPAATFLFSNPLPGLLLGILTVLQNRRRTALTPSIRLTSAASTRSTPARATQPHR